MSGNIRPQSSQLAEPLWTDSGLKGGSSVRELISTSKKKKEGRREMSGRTISQTRRKRGKRPPPPPPPPPPNQAHAAHHHQYDVMVGTVSVTTMSGSDRKRATSQYRTHFRCRRNSMGSFRFSPPLQSGLGQRGQTAEDQN